MNKEIQSTAKTTETSLEIIESLRALEGAKIDEISEYLGLSPSAVHRHLATLRKHEYVVQNDGVYDIGLRFLTVGGHAQRRVTEFPTIKEKVDTLAASTGERAQFIVIEHAQRIYLYTEVGESAVQTGAYIGKRGPLHTSAAGKSILAELSRDRVEEIIDARGLADGGPNSITDRAELLDELEMIREQGYAFNRQETTAGVHAVGSAVCGDDDEVVGALSVSGPANRITGEWFNESLPEQILGAVNELELHIKHSV